MTHIQQSNKEQIKEILENKFLLLKTNGERFLHREPLILQDVDSNTEHILDIKTITHSVPGLMKNYIILSLEERE